jgi:anti-sigma factor ChrR (cupin superfamily)
MPLHEYGTEHVALVKWAPNTEFQPHMHWGGEEILVLEGCFYDEHGEYPAGSWIRNPDQSRHTPYTRDEGALIYVKVGHLAPGRIVGIPV